MKKKFYICPHCKEKQDYINVWYTCSLPSKVSAKGYEYDYDRIYVGDTIEDITCPDCDQPLPDKITKLFGY